MMMFQSKRQRLPYYASLVALGMTVSIMPAFSQDQTTQTSAPASTAQDNSAAQGSAAPDNSGKNKHHKVTADSQGKGSAGDRDLTAKIRRAVVADKTLSMYAHNVKIITANGAVTLKGPVKSEDEKQKVASIAADAVGGPDKITNQISVKQ